MDKTPTSGRQHSKPEEERIGWGEEAEPGRGAGGGPDLGGRGSRGIALNLNTHSAHNTELSDATRASPAGGGKAGPLPFPPIRWMMLRTPLRPRRLPLKPPITPCPLLLPMPRQGHPLSDAHRRQLGVQHGL